MNTHELFYLKGKTAVITGGGNGIGKAVCEIMSAHGANVVIADLKIEVILTTLVLLAYQFSNELDLVN